jgi:PIN domain nuclease of toxin-antitoxin system
MAGVLLDTCAALWLTNGSPMTPESLAAIEAAQAAHAGVHVCPITAWEVATLVSRGRITLTRSPQDWFDALVASPGVRLTELSPRVLIESVSLPGAPPRDPADRMIAATGRSIGAAVITRDGELPPYGKAGHLSVIRC